MHVTLYFDSKGMLLMGIQGC